MKELSSAWLLVETLLLLAALIRWDTLYMGENVVELLVLLCQMRLSTVLVAERMHKLARTDVSSAADSASLGQEEWHLCQHPEIFVTSTCHKYADRASATGQIHDHHPAVEGFISAENIFCGTVYH